MAEITEVGEAKRAPAPGLEEILDLERRSL
jgi:hypothetical protein